MSNIVAPVLDKSKSKALVDKLSSSIEQLTVKHPEVFKNAVSRLDEFRASTETIESFERAFNTRSGINPDIDEKYWEVWRNLQLAHAID